MNMMSKIESASPAHTRTSTWEYLLSAYRSAKAAEDAYCALNIDPALVGCETMEQRSQAADTIPKYVWEEADRLQNIRLDAENPLMDLPAPTAEAFLVKFLIAYGEDRDARHWNDMLEDEAKRLAREVRS